MYLDRIAAYDKKGPALNAMIIISPNVLSAADALDAKFARSGFAPPHCVPLLILASCEKPGRWSWRSRTWRSSPAQDQSRGCVFRNGT
jgi:hypothetical protein